MGNVAANHGHRVAGPEGAKAQITAAGIVGAGWTLDSKEAIADAGALRWEHFQPANEQLLNLVRSATNGGGRCNDLGAHLLAVDLPGAQLIHGGLIEPDHRAKRPTDKVYLVLNDQIRWAKGA